MPLDHGYTLFSAISHVVSALHSQPTWGLHLIQGARCERGFVITPQSTVSLRLPSEDLHLVCPLLGHTLEIFNTSYPLSRELHAQLLAPEPNLHSPLVVFRDTSEDAPNIFRDHVSRQLRDLGVSPRAQFFLGRRRQMRVKGASILGYAVFVQGLSPEESLKIQTQGLGSRRHLGAGMFLPLHLSQTHHEHQIHEEYRASAAQL